MMQPMHPRGDFLALLTSTVLLAGAGSRSAGQQPNDAKSPGQAAYDRVCHTCHGPEGRGDAAPGLVPFDRSYEDLLAVVRDGRGQMPPISEKRLPNEEVAWIVEYLKGMAR
jgi:mono/diheme cytochrome c family protein